LSPQKKKWLHKRKKVGMCFKLSKKSWHRIWLAGLLLQAGCSTAKV